MWSVSSNGTGCSCNADKSCIEGVQERVRSLGVYGIITANPWPTAASSGNWPDRWMNKQARSFRVLFELRTFKDDHSFGAVIAVLRQC